MMEHDDPDDKLVQEFDVYLCNDHKAGGTQLCVLQQPLRPTWRPYDFDETQKARIKPNAMRFEVDIPLDTREDNPNYNAHVEDYKKIESVTLRSTVAESRTTYAVAIFQGDKLLLAPIDTTLQLRPQTSYLNVDPAKHLKTGKEGDSEEEEEGEGAAPKQEQLHAVEVDFKRRETEKQQQQRLNSYAYLRQKEEEEAWRELKVGPGAAPAAAQRPQRAPRRLPACPRSVGRPGPLVCARRWHSAAGRRWCR
jgi:DNA-directed RNA polymerase-3 subunit RPC5